MNKVKRAYSVLTCIHWRATTSAFAQRGKNVLGKFFEKRIHLQNAATVFQNEFKDINEMFKAGVTSTLAIYVAPQKINDFNLLRHNSFCKQLLKIPALNHLLQMLIYSFEVFKNGTSKSVSANSNMGLKSNITRRLGFKI